VENTPSFQPNPDLKLKLHDRAALNGKNKAVAFDHGDGKLKSSPFSRPSNKKQKSRFHRQFTAKNDFNNRAVPLSEPIGLPPENHNKIKN